jgi:proteasome lid subunit RPN8/RPN11
MPSRRIAILDELVVYNALTEAWKESQPGLTGGHEEGGFILRDEAGKMSVIRWPRGETDYIFMPPHADCRITDKEIIGTFHTHPNTGLDYLQEPGEADRRAVRDDPDLKGVGYVGELVISQQAIYLITPSGEISEVATTRDILSQEGG